MRFLSIHAFDGCVSDVMVHTALLLNTRYHKHSVYFLRNGHPHWYSVACTAACVLDALPCSDDMSAQHADSEKPHDQDEDRQRRSPMPYVTRMEYDWEAHTPRLANEGNDAQA
jgi:hypothetical protein